MNSQTYSADPAQLHQSLPPQSTSFVGREAEVAEIAALLEDEGCRLLTLVGPGGIGKTRLAIQVATESAQDFKHGVFFVGLQPLREVEDILPAIAGALGFQFARSDRSSIGFADRNLDPSQQLLDYLYEKQLLLIMDNFEHLLDGTAIVSEIIQTAPLVKVMATSREALNLRQEWVRPVEGMRFPEDHTARDIEEYSAVQLFADRARQVRAGFDLETEYPCVVQICRLVEGMPLALELAATWLRALSCEELIAEIGRNVDILKTSMRDIPERHRSIRAVFDCSWNMISPEEQDVFMKLSVFRGGASRQSVQAVTGSSLPVLSALVDKSLLHTTASGRYRIHSLLRQYTREKLETSGQLEAARSAHCDYFTAFLEQRLPAIKDHRQLTTLDEIDADFENVRAAWEWAIHCRNGEAIERMVECLCLFLWMRSRWSDGKEPLLKAHKAFAAAPGEEPSPTWGKLLARHPYDSDNRDEELETALKIARERNDREEIALALYMLGSQVMSKYNWSTTNTEELHRALALLDESIAIYDSLGDQFHVGELLLHKAWVYSDLNDTENMMDCTHRSLDIQRRIGNKQGEGYGVNHLGTYKFWVRYFDDAERLKHEALALAREVGNRYSVASALVQLGGDLAFGVRGEIDTARPLVNEGYTIAADISAKYTKVCAMVYQSLFASMEEDYPQARELGELARTYATTMSFDLPYSWALAVAYCGLADYGWARTEVRQLLEATSAIQTYVWATAAIPIAAILVAQEGHEERAVELLAFSCTSQETLTGWARLWPPVDRLITALTDGLGNEAFQTAWQQGQGLDLESVMEQLCADFQGQPSGEDDTGVSTSVLAANQALIEPLSERELEVLALIAAGLSNREIAEHLFIGVSTVKKHITHIYGKLEVDSRTRAIVRASDLGLV